MTAAAAADDDDDDDDDAAADVDRLCMVYGQNGRGLKRPQTNKAVRQNGRMNRSFHLAVVGHLYTYRCHCCVLYTGL